MQSKPTPEQLKRGLALAPKLAELADLDWIPEQNGFYLGEVIHDFTKTYQDPFDARAFQAITLGLSKQTVIDASWELAHPYPHEWITPEYMLKFYEEVCSE